jgi:hypothetical protein
MRRPVYWNNPDKHLRKTYSVTNSGKNSLFMLGGELSSKTDVPDIRLLLNMRAFVASSQVSFRYCFSL